MRNLRFVWYGLALGALFVASAAAAHGRFPRTGQIRFHPSNGDMMAVRGTFGLLLTQDGGETWRWVCVDALQASMNEDPAIAVMSDGAIAAGVFEGMARGTPQGCAWSFPSDTLEGTVVIDQVPHPADPAASFAVTSSGSEADRVYMTTDDAKSWEATGEAMADAAFLPSTLIVAPSDPQRLYVSGAVPESGDTARQARVYRSTDGGASWTEHPFTLRENEQDLHLAAVDPNDPERLFAWVEHDDPAPADQKDRLVVSRDGGASWTDLHELLRIRAFAVSSDGETMWVGGTDESGLWRSTDGGESFEALHDSMSVNCLTRHDDALWACAENFKDGFAIGRSEDSGFTFEPVMEFGEIEGVADCPADGATRMTCEPAYADLQRDLGIGTSPDGGVSGDGGTGGADGGSGDGGGGGCASTGAAPRQDAPAGLGWMVALLVAAAWTRRRR